MRSEQKLRDVKVPGGARPENRESRPTWISMEAPNFDDHCLQK